MVQQAEPTYATRRSPERYTDGPKIGEAIARQLGRPPTPSQQYELDVGLERVDGPGSRLAYADVVVIKGRRCGKTVTGFGVPHARALAGPITLPNGRMLPFRAVHVAQNVTAARQRFDEDLVAPYRLRMFGEDDEAWGRAAEYKRAAADTSLVLDPRSVKDVQQAKIRRIASELRVLAPSPNAARGSGVFHRTYDEELTYTLKRGQELAAAGLPTMAELFGQGQTWHLSNVGKFVDERYFLWHQRERGRKAVAADRRDGICYIEYSLPRDVDPNDEEQWWRYYPALGEGLVDLPELRLQREIFEELNHDNGATFFAEFLGRWADENETGLSGWETITLEDWQAALEDDKQLEQPAGARAVIGVDIDPIGRAATIVAATAHPVLEGVTYLEVIDHRPGSSWLPEAIRQLAGHVEAIAVDDHGTGRGLILDLEAEPELQPKLLRVPAGDFYAACYAFDADIREHHIKIRTLGHYPRLMEAAAAAKRSTGRGPWKWDRMLNPPQTPLVAATLASWGLGRAPEPEQFFVY